MNKLDSWQTQTYSVEQRLSSIGIMAASTELFAKDRDRIDIEATLASAFVQFSEDESFLRYLGPTFSWIEEHGHSVIAEKLVKYLECLQRAEKDVVFAALAGAYACSKGMRRWAALQRFSAPDSERFVGPSELARSLIKLRGEETWAIGSGLRLPKGTMRTDRKWVLSREALAKINRQYRNRLVYGAQWRADIITATEFGARTAAEASRLSGASYEPCHRVLGELLAAGKIRPPTKSA